LPGFAYHLGYLRQAEADVPDFAGGVGVEAERGFAIGANYTFSVPTRIGDVAFVPVVEFAHFSDADGVDGQSRDFLTTSLQAAWEGWNLALSRTRRNTNVPGGPDADDSMFQVSAGYAFDFGLTIDVGWRLSEEAGVEQRIFGALATYAIAF